MAKIKKRIKLSEVLPEARFHEEITTEPLTQDDILDSTIIVYDISDMIHRTKGGKIKYDSDNYMLLMSYAEDANNEKKLAWVNGEVVCKQLTQLKKEVTFPYEDGVEMCLVNYQDRYYKFQ